MDTRKFEIICELMDELKSEMEYSGDEIGERLGRPKPEMEVAKVEIEGVPEMESDMEDMEYEESPEDKLKDRLMKLRG